MRDRGLIVAWAVLMLLMAVAALYAELRFNGHLGAGVGPVGQNATGAAIAPDPGATGADRAGAPQAGPPQGGDGPSAPPAAEAETAEKPPPPEPPPSPQIYESPTPPARVAFAASAPPEDGRPRIVVIVSEIGVSSARSRQAVERLPPQVTLAVMAYAEERAEWVAAARAAGHEVLLAAPMEPPDYPRNDPGPEPLLIDRDDLENLARYDKALRNAAGAVGVLAHMGGRFLADRARLRPILAATQDRGLIFVDSRSTPDSVVAELASSLELHVLLNDRFIDEAPSADQIERRLAELEEIAARRGHAVGVASPYPVAIEKIREWAAGLDARGFVLAPASFVAAIPAF